MSKNERQIIFLTVIGVVLAVVSAGISAAVIPLIIGLISLIGNWGYENEVEKVKTSEQAQRSSQQRKNCQRKQATTPACKNILTQGKENVNHETFKAYTNQL